MFKKVVFVVFIVTSFSLFSQRGSEIGYQWQFGIGGDVIRFNDKHIKNMKDRYTLQLPRINATYKVKDNLSVDASVTFGAYDSAFIITNNIPYFAFDAALRYRYVAAYEKLNPYVFVGLGTLDASIDNGYTATVNGGTGITYWFAENIGVNGQVLYKQSFNNKVVGSHAQLSFSIIFGVNAQNKKGSARCYHFPN